DNKSDTPKFLYRQFFLTPSATFPHQHNLEGQIGIVTGSNSGLGFEASRQLLSLRISRLILAVRDLPKGEEARRKLAHAAPWAIIDVWQLDLSSYASVQAFARRCDALPKLDFAILNAGILKVEMQVNKSTGHEEVLQVNYLSTALLAIVLLPILAKSSRVSKAGKLTIVGSETAEWAKFQERTSKPILAAFNEPRSFDLQDRYYTSKLLEEFFVSSLCQTVSRYKVVVNIANPGFCYGSGLHAEVTGALGLVFGIYKRMIGRSIAIGARTLVNAAVIQGEQSHGRYLSNCAMAPFALMIEEKSKEAGGTTLWSETMAEFSFADAERIVEWMRA
ncbi:MAG: hypothetical protein Q9205_001707, partial [Flavoplaca limonia]